MLTAQGPFVNMKAGAGEWGLSTLVGLLLFGTIAASVATRPMTFGDPSNEAGREMTRTSTLGLGLLGVKEATPEANLTGTPADEPLMPRTRMSYLLPFELVSVHLLVVLIGAAYLARAKRRRKAVS
jgi:NADH-quinone oxidoreductase subunit J